MDDLNRWYDDVDADATPDDVFWEEMERQKLLNQIGGEKSESVTSSTTGGPAPVASTSSFPTASSGTTSRAGGTNPMSTTSTPPSQDELKSAEATMIEYEAYMVNDNWLDDRLAHQFWEAEVERDLQDLRKKGKLDYETSTLFEQRKENRVESDGMMQSTEEPWDTWGDNSKKKKAKEFSDEELRERYPFVIPRSKEIMEEIEEADRQETIRKEARLSKITIQSNRLENARDNPSAAAYFARKPDELEGYDRMWVSAIDNACFKNLVGVFRNYGVQFADNFDDWQNGSPEDGFASIEDCALYKAKKVHEVTGLPCIASRTSFEIEPVPIDSQSVGGPAGPRQVSNTNPRVTSGYRFNDVGPPVDHMIEALKPLSKMDRVTRLQTCLCYYDGEMEMYDWATCDVDLHFASSIRAFIPMSGAINGLCDTLKLLFGLEYQKWLNAKVQDSIAGVGYGNARVTLRDRVLKEGKILPNDIIDVSAFMDSQVDVGLMDECAQELANLFMETKPTKIVTVATTGLVIALPMAKYLQVPVVYARKERNVVMADTYKAAYSSKTVGKNRELLVSKSHLHPDDRCLVVDDFLSGGSSQEALLRIVSESGAKAVGVGVLLEKVYESGRQSLSGFDVPIHSLCRVASVQDGVIQLVEEEGFDRM